MPVMTTPSRMTSVPYHAVFRHSTTLLVLALLPLLVDASAVDAERPAANDVFTQIFNRTVLKRQSLHSIRARFTETTVSSLLEKPLVAHGTVIAAPPARVLMTYIDPERRTVALDSKSLVIVWPDRHERERIDISQTQKRIDQYFTQANPERLRSMFDIRAEPDAVLRSADWIDMRPRRKQMRDGLERLELWIDRDSLLLIRMQMTFPGGDKKTIALDDIAVNVPITDELFHEVFH
jgi:outer membrane lipoprotein-sorting protein